MAYEAWTVEWDMPVLLDDPFRRNSNSSWGTAPGGLVYTTIGGADTDYSVDRTTGRMLLGSVNVARVARLPINAAEVELTAKVYNHNAVVPAGAGFEYHARLRYVDDNNFVDLRLFPSTGNTVTCSIRQMVGGVETGSAFPTVSGATATSTLAIKVQVYGSGLRARVWVDGSDEPTTWNVEMTTTWLTAGALELRAIRGSGNTNTETIVIGWDDPKVTTPERWVDVTAYVDTSRGDPSSGGSPFTTISGDTPESSTDTGGLGLPLLNADQRFTPGNVLSPYAPNIAPGRRIRVRETVSDQVFYRFTGHVQYPEIAAWTESNGTSPRDQIITIPVVDRVAWIAQGRKFVSTLAEHIIYNAGPSLIGYWPMSESAGPDVNPFVGAPWTLTTVRKRLPGWIAAVTDQQPSITFGNSGIAPADDITSVSFTPTTITSPTVDYFNSFALEGRRPSTVTLGAGQVVTVVGWTRPGQLLSGTSNGTFAVIEFNYISGSTVNYISIWIDTSLRLVGGCNSPNWGGSVTGPPAPQNHSMPIAVRVGYDPAVLELWVRDEVYTGTNVVTSAQPALLDTALIADRYPGAVGHMQIYLGDPDDWTHDDFLAQYQMGLTGMERQTTGERVRTVLQYAGVDPSELGRIDEGASLMQVASLAGRGPIDLVTDAVTTEQGEFYADGSGTPVFADRIRLYNV